MSLEQLIRDKIKTAMREKDEVSKNVLRVAIGEVDVLKGRGQEVEDEQICKILRKLVASNEETIKAKSAVLFKENEILNVLLPKLLSKEEIENHLIAFLEEIKAAKSNGQATGVAVGVFKKINLNVDGKDVAEVVKMLRQGEI